MKVDSILIDKSKFENRFIKQYGFNSNEELMQAAKRQRDTLQIKGVEVCVLNGQYDCLGRTIQAREEIRLSVASNIKKDMEYCLENYYQGNCSEEKLAEAFVGYCERVGTTTGARLLDVYENFINESRYAANNVSIQKGNEITAHYGKVEEHDAVYYNADFYYSFEKVKEIAREISDRIAEKLELGELDFDERERSTLFNLDGGFDFNGKWAWNAQNLMNRCTMIDTALVPPEGFEFYYKERKSEDSEVGVMWVKIKTDYQKVTVPYTIPKAGVEGCVQKFNAAELCTLTEKDTENYKEYNEFLKNFDIYTRYYFAKMENQILS